MKPVQINRNALLKIKQKASTGECDDDAIKREYVDALTKASQNMVKNWDISIEKILERQQREKEEEKKAQDLSRIAFYNDLMEAKRKEREKIIADAKEIFFKQKDEPRLLEGALVCAEMLREQQAQREFNKKLKEEEKRRNLEYSKFVDKLCEEWKQQQIIKRQRRIEKDIKESLIIKEQAERNRQNLLNEKKEKLELEKQDKINEKKEMDELNTLRFKMKKEEQKNFRMNVKSAMEEVKARKIREKQFNEKENELIEIYRNTQMKIHDMRIQKEREIQNERMRIRSVIYKPDHTKALAEEEKYQKEQEKIRQREIEIIEEEKARKELQKEKRLQDHRDWLERERRNNENKNNILLWEIANRFQNIEYTEQLNAKIKDEERRKKDENKAFLIQQQKEKAEKMAKEKMDRLKFFNDDRNEDVKAADEKFLAFANQLLSECEAMGRPTYPLHKVIKDYKDRYMVPERKLSNHLRTHFKSITTNTKTVKANAEKICKCVTN